MPTNPELFVEHLQSVFGPENAIQRAEAADGGPPVCVFVYKDVPEKGMITGITYGLSLCPFPAWKFSRPEMIVSVRSLDVGWPCAAGVFAADFRGKKRFQYGDVFTTDAPLATDSTMNGFLVFAQGLLSRDSETLQLDNYKVHFSQFYPIYQDELAVYERIGLEAFLTHEGLDMYDVSRRPITV